jgi:hypothetical protein
MTICEIKTRSNLVSAFILESIELVWVREVGTRCVSNEILETLCSAIGVCKALCYSVFWKRDFIIVLLCVETWDTVSWICEWYVQDTDASPEA